MTHKVVKGFEINGAEVNVPTAGFKSDKAAINARLSKKNRKRVKPKFHRGPNRRANAKAEAQEISSAADKKKQLNSSMGQNPPARKFSHTHRRR